MTDKEPTLSKLQDRIKSLETHRRLFLQRWTVGGAGSWLNPERLREGDIVPFYEPIRPISTGSGGAGGVHEAAFDTVADTVVFSEEASGRLNGLTFLVRIADILPAPPAIELNYDIQVDGRAVQSHFLYGGAGGVDSRWGRLYSAFLPHLRTDHTRMDGTEEEDTFFRPIEIEYAQSLKVTLRVIQTNVTSNTVLTVVTWRAHKTTGGPGF